MRDIMNFGERTMKMDKRKGQFLSESFEVAWNLANIHVYDILKHEQVQPIHIVPKSVNIFEVENIFGKSHKEKQKLEGVIITENGRSNEAPLGIITAWDLIEIDYTID
jgi:hypothetical protein